MQPIHRRASGRLLPLTLAVALLATLLGGVWMATPSDRAQAQSVQPISGNVIVLMKPSAGNVRAASPFAIASALGLGILNHVFSSVFNGFSANITPAQATALAANPNVAGIFPNLRVYTTAQTTPTGIQRVGDTQNPIANIGSGQSVNVDVAVLDEGVSTGTGDLNVAGSQNCVPSGHESGSTPGDHATHVSGTIGAIDNGSGVVGIAPGARIWSVRVLADDGSGYLDDVICGLNWVASNSGTIKVVNMSLESDSVGDNLPFHQAVQAVVDAGVTVVVAAGNSSTNDKNGVNWVLPAAFPEVITVGAISDYDGKPGSLVSANCSTGGTDDAQASYSNYGKIDIVAPGTCIKSLSYSGSLILMSGTSMATPHVTGAVALHRSQVPNSTPAQDLAWLLSSASAAKTSLVGYTGANLTAPILWLGSNSALTPTATATKTSTPTKTPTKTPTPTNTATSTPTPTATQITVAQGSPTDTPTVTDTPTDTDTPTPTNTSTPTNTATPTSTATATRTPTNTATATNTATNTPTKTPTSTATATATKTPTKTSTPTKTPTSTPTKTPTKTATPTKTPTPNFTGAYTLTDSKTSSGAFPSSYVRDKNLNTLWRTLNTGVKSSAWFYVDLGSAKPIGQIRWYMGQTGMAKAFSVQISTNTSTWTTVTTGTNSPTGQWTSYTLPTAQTARYVRFYFTNPTSTPMLGGIAEVSIYPPAANQLGVATSTPTKTATPTKTPTANAASAYALPNSKTSSGAFPSSYVRDGNLSTLWRTLNTGVRASAWFYVDLGASKPIGQIRWYITQTGMAKAFAIQTSTNASTWTTLTNGTDSPAGQWATYNLPSTVTARYIRFYFTNPTSLPMLGGIGEVAIYPPTQAQQAAAAQATPIPTATSTSTSIAASATATQTATAAPSAPTDTPTFVATATETPTVVTEPTDTPTDILTETPTETAPTDTPTEADAASPTDIAAVDISAIMNAAPGYKITGTERSPFTTSAIAAVDDDPSSVWTTETSTTPDSAWMIVDLGSVKSIGKVGWLAGPDGLLGTMTIEISSDHDSWQSVLDPDTGDPMTWTADGQPVDWQAFDVNADARYVRFSFTNPDGASVIGNLAEIRVLPPG